MLTRSSRLAGVHVADVFVCDCRPLRADECLPVLTHRLVPDAVTDDKDVTTTSHRHHNDSRKKKDRKVLCVLTFMLYDMIRY